MGCKAVKKLVLTVLSSNPSTAVIASHDESWHYLRLKRFVPLSMNLIMGKAKIGNSPKEWLEQCEWLRNPFPPSEEDELNFGGIRRRLRMEDADSPRGKPRGF